MLHLQQPGAPFGQHLNGAEQHVASPEAPPAQHCAPAEQQATELRFPPALGVLGRQQVEPVSQQVWVLTVPQQNASPPQQLADRLLLQQLALSPQQRPPCDEAGLSAHQAQPAGLQPERGGAGDAEGGP